jgi:hypothetical protein
MHLLHANFNTRGSHALVYTRIASTITNPGNALTRNDDDDDDDDDDTSYTSQ